MEKKYYYSETFRLIMWLILAWQIMMTIILLGITWYLFTKRNGTEALILSLITLILLLFGVLGYFLWQRFSRPFAEISDSGIKLNNAPFGKGKLIQWPEIKEIIINDKVFHPGKAARLIINSPKGYYRTIYLNLCFVEQGEELLDYLQKRITNLKNEDIILANESLFENLPQEVSYKKYRLSEKGIGVLEDLIPWEQVIRLSSSEWVIAGFGGVKILYRGPEGKVRTLTVTPVTSIQYQQFVTYLIWKSVNASIDPQLTALIKKTPQEAKKEFIAIGCFIPGIIFFFMILFKVISYVLTPNGFALILGIIFIGIALIGINLMMYVSSANGRIIPNRLKIMGAILLNIWLISSITSFFYFRPLSWTLLQGDWASEHHRWNEARLCYKAIADRYPKNKSVLYLIAQTYLEQQQYEKGLSYLIRAYETNPARWRPQGVRQIPETLIKLQRYREAMEWCDRIIKENPRRFDIVTVMKAVKSKVIELAY